MPEKQPPDITALKQGSEAAFRNLVEAWQQQVYSTALSMMQDAHDADDVTQDVFITVFEQVGAFREESSFSTWIYRITVNKCVDALRKKNRYRFSAVPEQEKNGSIQFHHPGVLLEQKENAARLFSILKTLPPTQQAAFILQRAQGLSIKEIADVLKTTTTAVESLLARAKKTLANKLNITK